MHVPHLQTERLTLRLAELSDLPAVLAYWKQSGQRYNPPLPLELQNERYWQERILVQHRECLEGTGYRLCLFLGEEMVGTLALSEVTKGVRYRASLGYGISERLEGQGYMSEAVRAAIDFAFRSLNLHRIEATYAVANERSGRLLRRLGFVTEGTLRQFHYTGQGWLDQVITSLLNPDWQPPPKL